MSNSSALHLSRLSETANGRPLPVVATWAIVFALLVTKWDRRVRTRRQLRKLDAARLMDVGISPEDAHHEIEKKFWQP